MFPMRASSPSARSRNTDTTQSTPPQILPFRVPSASNPQAMIPVTRRKVGEVVGPDPRPDQWANHETRYGMAPSVVHRFLPSGLVVHLWRFGAGRYGS